MIPILYEENTTDFSTNGIGRLSDCISCTVEEKESGVYECKFKYPMTGIHYADIQEKRIIYCTHDDAKVAQPLEIYSRSAAHKGVVTFFAHHVSYKLGNVIVDPFSANSALGALEGLKQHEINTSPFTYWTDKSSIGSFEIKVPTAVRAILGGVQGSILDAFGGGDYEWDGYTVKLWNDRGQDNNISIRYGVNMLSMVQETDDSSVFNAVAPFWFHESTGEDDPEILVTVPGKIVRASSATSQTLRPITLDLSDQWQTPPTVQQLTDYAEAYMNQRMSWKLEENITVDFVALWQTEDYKDVAPLQRVRLYDYVHIVHDELGINKKLQVVATKYNVLTERYDSIELGVSKPSFAEVVSAVTENNILKEVPTKSFMEQAIAVTADTIRGSRGGYKLEITDADGHTMETLYMDAPNVEDAVNILRIGMSGIAFSNHGYDPEYFVSAWDINGNFNANFITSGVLNANLIKAGIISDLAGKNYWNMETGEFSLQTVPPVVQTAIDTAAASAGGYILETPFTWSNNNQTANFTAVVYKGTSNVTTEFPDSWFVWTLRTEDGETQLGTGKTLSVNKSLFGYGATITCTFTTHETAALRSVSGAKLKSVTNKQMLMYADQDTDIIVSDLPVKTAAQVSLSDTLMGIDNVEGYQISIQNFSDVILKTVTNTIDGRSQTVVAALGDIYTKFGNYVLTSDLTTTLGNYVLTSDLTTTLADYVLTNDLNTALGNYVLKAGDTMTGSLYISTSSGAASSLKNTATAADGSTVTSQVPMAYRWTQDKNGYTCFYTETQKQTTGQIYQSFVVRNKINGTDYPNGFYLYVSNTGVPAVGFSNDTVRDAWATGLNVVKKAGDTMTGVLTISVARNTSYRIKFTDIDARIGQTAPSSNIYWDKSYVLDKNDRLMHYEEGVWGTNNNFSFTYGLRRHSANGSSSYTNYFNLGIDNSGNGSVLVSHPAAWRTALDVYSKSESDSRYVNVTGDTVTGKLTLSGGLSMTTSAHVEDPPYYLTLTQSFANGGAVGYVTKAELKKNALTWTLIAETSGTTAKSYSSIAGYTEALIMAWYSTSYMSFLLVPLGAINLATEWEMYLGGGRSGTGTGQRKACCKFSGTKITPIQIAIDGSNVNGNWRVYVR